MLVYVYDGTFEGLLTAVYEAYYCGERPQQMLEDKNLQLSLVDRYVHIGTDADKADKVYRSITDKISRDALDKVYHVFLSNEENRGGIIYEYLRLGWKMGRRVDFHLSDDRVLRVHAISQRVNYEVHKLMGFVRFKALEGDIYYATIEPDHNIVELLAPHFAERFPCQKWVIHDLKRELAAVYDGQAWSIVRDVPGQLRLCMEAGELEWQAMWKEFFHVIAIPNRINPKLQKRLMPVRYWKHLTEI